jgi:hypothetical protein
VTALPFWKKRRATPLVVVVTHFEFHRNRSSTPRFRFMGLGNSANNGKQLENEVGVRLNNKNKGIFSVALMNYQITSI